MKIIDVFIENKNELFEKYNKEIVSYELINYIVSRTMYIKKREQIELKLHVTKETSGCTQIIKNRLKEEYEKSIRIGNISNIKQFMLLTVGILTLILSTFISENNILHEVIIIAGWVPIWEAVDVELFADTKEKRKRKLLRKIINSNMIEIVKE